MQVPRILSIFMPKEKKLTKWQYFRFCSVFTPIILAKSGIFRTFAPLFFKNLTLSYMKRIFALVVCLLLAMVAFSQDNNGFSKNRKEKIVVHDTVYIYIHDNDTIMVNNDEEEEEDEEEEDEFS